ncbi:MAG: trehalose-6-phosphate synthase, partial [Alphaproteobacteria bacterium]|nr:trehalose-6-phosphate synthase [Alphaproteobacteria bacterium]
LNKSFARRTLFGLLRTAQVGLITPLRDGMNLVAMEYIASQSPSDPGVLVLSRFAGAARSIPGALIVNPYDAEGMAEAIQQALDMPRGERVERWHANMEALRRNDVSRWREIFVSRLMKAPFA